MSPNIMNMEKEPQERDMLNEDGDGAKPKVRPVETALERLYRMGYTRRALLIISVLAVMTLILFVTVIALAVRPCCYSPHSDRPKCLEPDCYRTTARIVQQVNTSVEPCENFYDFACGGWLRDHEPIPGGYGDVGVTVNSLRDFLAKSRETIETLQYPDNFRSLEWKVKAFYHSCLDLSNIDSSGDTFLRRQIDLLKGWKPKKDWNMNNWDYAKVLRDLHVDYGAFPFFAVSVRPDDINPYQNVIQISPSGLGLPHYSYYFRNPDDKVIQAYQRLMRDLAQILGVTFQDSLEFATNVFHFEKRIAEILDFEDKHHGPKEKQKITLADLRQESQRVIWVDFLKAYFPKAYISESTPIFLESRRYIKEVSNILSTTDKGALNSYMIWTFIFKYAPYLNKNFRETVEAYRLVFSGASESRPRWEFCIEATNRIFGVALTSFYVEKHILKTTLLEADLVFRHVRSAFADTLLGMKWMEDAAQPVSDKVRGINSRLMYENYVLSESALDSYYEMLEISRVDFVQNIQTGAIFHRLQIETAIANASRLYMNTEVNRDSSPYYSEFNRFVNRPVLLQEPYYHSYYPKYMVFGSLGFHLGQELVRAIEEPGNGTVSDLFSPILWNNVSLPVPYHTCLISNYSQFTIDKHSIDGNKSFASNLADIGGLTQAYKAMINWEENNGLEPTLPDVAYSPEQLFFISYAQTMCTSMTPAYLDNFQKLSESPPDKIRVLGTLSQIPQFSAAFDCKPVRQPAPQHCKLW